MAQPCRSRKIYDIFEGTAEIQQMVISRAISGIPGLFGAGGSRS